MPRNAIIVAFYYNHLAINAKIDSCVAFLHTMTFCPFL